MKITNKYNGLLLILIMLSLWEAGVKVGYVDAVYFPSPTQILLNFGEMEFIKTLMPATLKTVYISLLGFIISSALAVTLGILISKFRFVYSILEPIIEFMRPLPSAAIIPIGIMLLGIDFKMKISVVAFAVFWPVLVNTIQGISRVSKTLIETGEVLGLSRWESIQKIEIPSALPTISAGLRISLAISLILSVTTEMIAGSSGLGFLLIDYERGFDFKKLYAVVLVVGVIGYVYNKIYISIESRIIYWPTR